MSALAPRQERLTRLTAAIVLADWGALRAERRGAPPGEPDRAWREAVLQTHLFSGFPRLIEAYEVLAEEGGLGEAGPDESEGGRVGEEHLALRGAALFERIYADASSAVRARLAGFHPDWAGWIASHPYARVLSRPGLPAHERELLAVAALLATGHDRQLASHARGAIRCGASPEQVGATADLLAGRIDPGRLARGREVLARFARVP